MNNTGLMFFFYFVLALTKIHYTIMILNIHTVFKLRENILFLEEWIAYQQISVKSLKKTFFDVE